MTKPHSNNFMYAFITHATLYRRVNGCIQLTLVISKLGLEFLPTCWKAWKFPSNISEP